MPRQKSYAHDAHGINVTNLRSIAYSSANAPLAGVPPIPLDLLRSGGGGGGGTAAGGALLLGEPELLSARLRHSAAHMRATAAQQVESQLRSVEGAIQTKLAKTRGLVEALQGANHALDTELEAMARCAARLRSAEGHLASQLGLNQARQQVRSSRPASARSMARAAATSAVGRLIGPDAVAPAANVSGRLASTTAGPSAAAIADEAARQLHHQSLLLDNLSSKAARCSRLVEAANARLLECRARVVGDLRAKAQALSIDEAVLGLHGGGSRAVAAALTATTPPAGAAAGGGTPLTGGGGRRVSGGGDAALLGGRLGSSGGVHGRGEEVATTAVAVAAGGGNTLGRRKWEGDTAALLAGTHQLVAECGRLRKKVKAALVELSAAVVSSAHAVNESLSGRIQDARKARAALQERLRAVEAEAARAAKEQQSLRKSIEENRAPLEQLQARFDMRRRRPELEHVNDEVESALAAEAAGLAAVTRQLQRHEAAVGEQVQQLRATAEALRPTIDDRAAAEEAEELAARLDGREDLESPRAPSIISVCASTVVSGYSTLGDSASQVCHAPSIRGGGGWPPAAPHRSARHTPLPPRGARCRHPTAAPSESGVTAAASSVASSSAGRGAVARIATLEKELAEARAQTCALEAELRVVQRRQSDGQSAGPPPAAQHAQHAQQQQSAGQQGAGQQQRGQAPPAAAERPKTASTAARPGTAPSAAANSAAGRAAWPAAAVPPPAAAGALGGSSAMGRPMTATAAQRLWQGRV